MELLIFVFSIFFTSVLKTLFYICFMLVFMTFFLGSDWVMTSLLLDKMSFSIFILFLIVMMILSVILEEKKLVINSLGSFIIMTFFFTDSILWFFIMFEMSLVPLVLFIMYWGKQVERLSASRFLFLYTLISSSTLLIFLANYLMDMDSFFLPWLMNYSPYMFPLSILAFLVKIPVFFFHPWLTKAHVEAPLEGSMILAGIMLKFGLFGLIRMFFLSHMSKMMDMLLFSVCISGACISAIISISSDDMKMSVAYSSISHMNFLVGFLLSMKILSFSSAVIIMFTHGISSPMLFYLVTKVYNYSNSRSMLINKGILSKFPLMNLMSFLLWVLNISIPPLFSFLGELWGIMSLMSFYQYSSVLVVVYLMSSSFFSMMNYGVISHSSNKLQMKMMNKDYQFLLISMVMIFYSTILFFSSYY